MIEDEQRVQLPRLLQKTLSGNTFLEEARLHPGKLSPTLRMQPLSTATMILPESDPDIVMHDLVELYNQHGSCGIFRVVDIQPAYGKNRSVTLNHALDVLNDAVYPSNTEEFNGTVTAYLTKLLGAQKQKVGNTPYWQLGTVEDTGTWHQEFNYDNILDLIKEIPSEHEDYYFTFDFSVFPWRLNLIARNDDVLTEFRASRNIASCKVTQSDKDQCTRLYLSITTKSTVTEGGKTAGKKSTVTFEVHDDAQGQATWGVIEKTAGIETDKVPAAEKAAWVQGYFDRHRDPNVQISISGYDLKEQTGEDIDEMHLSRVCRAVLPRYNTTLLERIVEVTYPDALGQPSKVDVSMANKRQTTEDNIASAQKEAKKAGGGGGAAKQQAENNATEIEFQKIRYDLQVLKDEKRFAVIATESWYEQMDGGGETLVGQYTSNVETTARKLTSAFNVTGVKLDNNGDPVVDEETGDYVFDGSHNSLSSQVSQTASELRSEVARATGAESSLSSSISQTAGEIRTEVSKKVDKTTYNSYVSQTATEIAAKVGKTDVSITDNGISITGVSGTLDISGLRTKVGALEADHVSTDDLDAVEGRIDKLVSGNSYFSSLSVTGGIAASSIGVATLSVGGDGFSARGITIGSKSIQVLGSTSGITVDYSDLPHYHGISISVSGGTVTITQGAAQSTAGSDSFNIADTKFYKDAVSAAEASGKAAMGITYSWSDNVLSISVTESTTKSGTVTITASHSCVYNPSTHEYTITGSALADGEIVKTSGGTGSGTQAYEDGKTDGKGTITGITQRLTAVYSEDDKEYTVYARASGSKLTNSDNRYDAQLYVSGSAAYNHGHRIGVADGEAEFSLVSSLTLQGSPVYVTPISGNSVYCYQTSQVTGTNQGNRVRIALYDADGNRYNTGGVEVYLAGSSYTYYTRYNGAYRYAAGSQTLYYTAGQTKTNTYYTKS